MKWWYYFLMCSIVFHIKNEFAFCLIVLDATSNTCLLIYLWFSWKKNKANMCHLLSWGYLPSSFLKHKTTFHYMTTLNGPEQSSKTSPWDKSLMCGNWSQNILTFLMHPLFLIVYNFHAVPEFNSRWPHAPRLWKGWCFPAMSVLLEKVKGQLEFWGEKITVCDFGILSNLGNLHFSFHTVKNNPGW